MKIGLMTPYWPTTDPDSGIGNSHYRLACALANRGHQVTVLHINKNKPFWRRGHDSMENGYRFLEVPCRVFPQKSWRGRLLASHLAAMAILFLKTVKVTRQFDVMETFSQGGFPWFYTRYVSRGKYPVLVRVATTGIQMRDLKVQGKRIYGNWLENSLIRTAHYLCTHTRAHRDEICTALGLEPSRMAVIPLGIGLPVGQTSPISLKKFVLIAGRFEERKGTDLALAAVPLVLAKQPDCQFVFAGGGDKAEAWKSKFLEEHGHLADRVSFAGRVSSKRLDELYQTCDFFVSPARYESFGLTYLEAMRQGKPVIGCRQSGGAEEVIGDGGLLVPRKTLPVSRRPLFNCGMTANFTRNFRPSPVGGQNSILSRVRPSVPNSTSPR